MNNVEWTILGLLTERPQTGYDVLRVFKTSPALPYRSSSGSVYPALKSLTRQGMAAVVTEKSARGRRGSVTYKVTQAGRVAFRRWLETPVVADVPEATTETLVRLLFAHLAPRGATRRMLEEYRLRVHTALAPITTALNGCPPDCPPHQTACLMNGEMTLQAQLRWVDKALEALNTTS